MPVRIILCATLLWSLISSLCLSADPIQDAAAVPVAKLPSEPLALLDSQSLFVSGTDGTHTYRIPAIITAMLAVNLLLT
jgi:hypothetical protein